jgi:hypothetical protein
MEMIIAELHESSRQIVSRARIVLWAAMRIAGEALPMLSQNDRTASEALATPADVLKDAQAIRGEALHLKSLIKDNVLSYPTQASFSRRLSRACEATQLSIRAEAHMTKLIEGETAHYRALMSLVIAFRMEQDAHMDKADALGA